MPEEDDAKPLVAEQPDHRVLLNLLVSTSYLSAARWRPSKGPRVNRALIGQLERRAD
jgi:hypothetical protein